MTPNHPRNDLLRKKLRLEWLPIEKLFVDKRAQRAKLDEQRVQRIVRNFDPLRFEALRVNDRGDGTYAIEEGGHRRRVCEVLDIRWLPCLISDDRSGIAAEAETFLGISEGRKGVSLVDQQLVGVTAQREEAVAIQGICDERGLQISTSNSAGHIASITALRQSQRSLIRGMGPTRIESNGSAKRSTNVASSEHGSAGSSTQRCVP